MDNQGIKYQVAVATTDGIVVNQHFGRAESFQIYAIDKENAFHLTGERKFPPLCQGGVHDDLQMKERGRGLSDCKYVLVSKIGQGAINALEQEGITPMELPGFIEEALKRLIAYDQVRALFP